MCTFNNGQSIFLFLLYISHTWRIVQLSPYEYFLQFLPIFLHKAKKLFKKEGNNHLFFFRARV